MRRCGGHCRSATGSPPRRIALGNGSCDILLAAGEALLEPGAEVVYAWPAFSVYPHLAAASGARAIEVPLDDRRPPRPRRDRRGDHGGHAAGADLQPEQPDLDLGRALAAIEEFLDRVPSHVCVILDEAYCEFALTLGDPYASVELLRRYPNLVLLRTFSKVYGLAALRVGLRAVRRRTRVPHRGRPGPPAVLSERGRAGRRRRGAEAPGRSGAPGRADARGAARRSRRACGDWVCGSPSPTPTSSGCGCPTGSTRRRWWRACGARRARARRRVAGACRRAARDRRHGGGERPLRGRPAASSCRADTFAAWQSRAGSATTRHAMTDAATSLSSLVRLRPLLRLAI